MQIYHTQRSHSTSESRVFAEYIEAVRDHDRFDFTRHAHSSARHSQHAGTHTLAHYRLTDTAMGKCVQKQHATTQCASQWHTRLLQNQTKQIRTQNQWMQCRRDSGRMFATGVISNGTEEHSVNSWNQSTHFKRSDNYRCSETKADNSQSPIKCLKIYLRRLHQGECASTSEQEVAEFRHHWLKTASTQIQCGRHRHWHKKWRSR